uniref:DZF domain-containing protein n=1 Tax=Macrostomum lignano TaxID=282301 RepID=A0A1I8F919_9PLAT
FQRPKMNWSSQLYRKLNGVLCIYKPPHVSPRQCVNGIVQQLCDSLNDGPFEPTRPFTEVIRQPAAIEQPSHEQTQIGSPASPAASVESISHRLVARPDLRSLSQWPTRCPTGAAGVQLVGLGRRGIIACELLERQRLLKVYRVRAVLGRATHDCTGDGTIVLRTTWRHVTPAMLERVCTVVEAGYKRQLLAGLRNNTRPPTPHWQPKAQRSPRRPSTPGRSQRVRDAPSCLGSAWLRAGVPRAARDARLPARAGCRRRHPSEIVAPSAPGFADLGTARFSAAKHSLLPEEVTFELAISNLSWLPRLMPKLVVGDEELPEAVLTAAEPLDSSLKPAPSNKKQRRKKSRAAVELNETTTESLKMSD